LRILQTIPFLTPARGGSVKALAGISKELSRRHHEVTILTTNFEFDKNYADILEKNSIEVVKNRAVMNLGLYIYSPEIVAWLKANVRRYDIVHLHQFRSYQNSAIHHRAILDRIPYIVQAHGSVMPFFERVTAKKVYDLLWGRRLLKDAAALIAVTELERAEYVRMGATSSKIEVIPNFVETDPPRASKDFTSFREEIGLAKSDELILFLGRIHAIKGLDFLIRGFALIAARRERAFLAIVGPDDGYKSVLVKLTRHLGISDRVKFVNSVSEVRRIYRESNVLVYPSRYEVFGLVPFEALLENVPVVVTEESGCGELIRKSGGGYLVTYGNSSELAERISEVLEDPHAAALTVAKGQSFVRSHLSRGGIVGELERVYENCIHHF
jgi:glycosyltransferase involved in cell wall biosynthesis